MMKEISPRTAEIELRSSATMMTTAIVINAIMSVLAFIFITYLYKE